MTNERICAICGAPAVDEHHLTGRNMEHKYLHPDATVPLCHDDHELCGEDLRDEGLEKPCADTSAVGELAYGIARVAVYLSRAIEADPDKQVLAPIATVMRDCEQAVYEHIRSLDSHDPRWRYVDGT